MQSKRLPALQALAEAQLAWRLPNRINARLWNKKGLPSGLARINEEIKRHRTQLDTHLQACLNSDQAESAAQSRQAEAWLKPLPPPSLGQSSRCLQPIGSGLDGEKGTGRPTSRRSQPIQTRFRHAKGQIGILEPELQAPFATVKVNNRRLQSP